MLGIYRYFSFICLLLLFSTANAQQRCNICGEGNTIQYPQGVVQFDYDGERLKNNCQTLQRIVDNNPFAISTEFCRTEMLQYTHRVCRCTTADGKAVEWSPPTEKPSIAPSSSAPTTVYPTVGTAFDVGAPTELPLEWTTDVFSSAVNTPSPTIAPTLLSASNSEAPMVATSAGEESLSPTGVISRKSSGRRLGRISYLVMFTGSFAIFL